VTSNLLLYLSRNDTPDETFVVERGEGSHVFDRDGRRYIDGMSGLYCVQLGYSYGAEMSEAADKVLRELCYHPLWSGAAHPLAIELAERITALAPDRIEQVFLCGGGTEAVETAWKLARKYHLARGEPQRTKAIARRNAYHGLSLGTLSLNDDPALTEPYGPPPIDTRFVANTNPFRRTDTTDFTADLLAEIETTILAEGPDTIGMLIAEPVQNRGGCITPPEGYWAGLRRLADTYGFLLVADEVITGFGRLGDWFGGDRYGAKPDLVTVAKGLTAGYAPMGATLVGPKVAEVLRQPGMVLNHGYTFGGHPLSAAIALRSMEIMERDNIFANVRAHETRLATKLAELRTLAIVGDVRGAGFFHALELLGDGPDGTFRDTARAALVQGLIPRRLREAGLLVRVYNRARPVLQLAPTLVSQPELLDEIVEIIADVLSEASTRLELV
jgi:adenosylmethionine-8-amino-7-oxononanoate aminotransferase